jgi:hypothetical protein
MSTRPGRLRTRFWPLVAGLCVALTACSEGSARIDPAATILPTPTTRVGQTAAHLLDQRVRALLAARVLSVDEDLQTGDQEQEVRLTSAAHGFVVEASSVPIAAGAGAGTEVYRSPTALLQRSVEKPHGCWSPGAAAAARFDRPAAQEIVILNAVRADGEQDGLLTGSVSARALLGLLGSDDQLRSRGLVAPDSARVPATFTLDDDELQITTGWGSLAAAAGTKRAGGTWTVRYRVFAAAGPTAPTADMMCP